jgi:hypothetical protein
MISQVVVEGLLGLRAQLELAIGGECALVGESYSPIGRVLVYKACDLKSMPAYYLLAWWWCCVVLCCVVLCPVRELLLPFCKDDGFVI